MKLNRTAMWGMFSTCLSILLLINQGGAQEACMNELQAVYAAINKQMEHAGKAGFYIHFTQSGTLNESLGAKVQSEELFLSHNGKVAHIRSKHAEVFQDEKFAISILPAEKKIYINRSSSEQFRMAKRMQSTEQFEKLLQFATVEHCEAYVHETRRHKKMELVIPEAQQAVYQIQKLTYVLDLDKKLIVELKMEYVSGASQYDRQLFQFHEVNYAPNDLKLAGSAKKRVFKSEGELLPAYADYSIVDNTKMIQP